MNDLRGRVAVVTGAASGIGLALAQRFAAAEMKVVLADIEEPALEAAVASLRASGADAVGVPTDVSSASAVIRLADRTIAEFGEVHVVCNNAGVDTGAPFTEIPLASWDWVLGVNLWGVIHGCRTFLPLIRRHGDGHVVNTASFAALHGHIPTSTPYVASKFAVLGLSENLFHELATGDPGIGVSVLCPAFVSTNMPFGERNLPEGVPALDDHPGRRAIVDYSIAKAAAGMAPELVAGAVVQAIRDRRFYVLPHHDEARGAVEARLRWMVENEPPPPRAGRPAI